MRARFRGDRGLGGVTVWAQRPQGLRLSDRRELVYVARGCDFRLVSEWPVVFTRREEGCVFMRVSVFTSVGLEEDRGNLCVDLSVKLPVLIRILEADCLCTIRTSSVNRHIYVTTYTITCLHMRTCKNKTLLHIDFYTVNVTLST